MVFSNKALPLEFPFPEKVKIIACCDLDETYIPFSQENRQYGGVGELEEYLGGEGSQKGILLGWITGTNMSSALRKAQGYISRSPHFLCCSLGTEFYWIKAGRLVPSVTWTERIKRSGFRLENVDRILKAITERGILLEKQPEDYQGPYKASFYYRVREEISNDFDWIENQARTFNIRTLFTKCNPAAGDPADSYDMEFIPRCCGKDEAVSFLMERMGLRRNAVLAFGDSCNDFPMFERAGHAYLVANADSTAIDMHGRSLDRPYCHGILSVLKGV